MTAIEFEQQNIVIGKDQPEYQPLPAFLDTTDPTGPATFCMQLDEKEIEELISSGGKLWFTQFTFQRSFSPIRMSTLNPFIEPDKCVPSGR